MLPRDILDKYQILKLFHDGIGGKIWLAEHKSLGCRRLIKSVSKAHPQYGFLVKEAKLLQQFHHPSIPIIYDIMEYDTAAYLIEEFIEGENLKQYFLRRPRLSAQVLLDYSTQLCEILEYIHGPEHQVLHLDIKPENILLSNHQLKLVDFGSAICRKQQPQAEVFFGSPGFCAPEQSLAGNLSEETDLYGLGRLLEYMMFYAAEAPRGFTEIVKNCLREGQKTYRTAAQVKTDLQKIRQKRIVSSPAGHWFAVTGVPADSYSSGIALQLAAYVRRYCRGSVLFLDCNPGSPMEIMEKYGESEEEKGFVFERNGITVAKRIAPQEAKGWRGRGYDFVICDFGNHSPLTAGIPFELGLFAGSLTEWTYPAWEDALKDLDTSVGKYVLVLTEGDLQFAVHAFGQKYAIGQLSDFFSAAECSREGRRFFKRLLCHLL